MTSRPTGGPTCAADGVTTRGLR
ncbi:Protein of unknown function [Propionibacterium freudenreichii]|nr:Protein of unknown function [Propionibacterium freudenreichii subsp. freudenreichii]CEG89148.1 Protein of unknown function [Propionibacterium freudenreichii]CEG94664.1 Protein of unknown function [Propionibacterium freudenreichii]CEG98183.1 Protein of unknown function [Propionibacterium freudenreichii]CEH04093.1 Protein of unknown function [Propionibacterium freudenreichii]